MKTSIALFLFVTFTAAWCVAGICGWTPAGNPVVDALCLPVNLGSAVLCAQTIRRERELERQYRRATDRRPS